MRILLINYEYPPVGGGAANATWEIARALVKLGHEPVFEDGVTGFHLDEGGQNLGLFLEGAGALAGSADICERVRRTASWRVTASQLLAMLKTNNCGRPVLHQEKPYLI